MSRRAVVIAVGAVALGLTGVLAWLERRDTRRDPVDAASVVLLGDSITEQGDWEALLPGRPIVNAGHSGFTTAELVDVARSVAAGGPRIVYVLAGTNDIRDSLPVATTAADYGRLLDELATSPSTTVVVQTLLPRADAPSEVAAINDELVSIATARGLRVVDLTTPFDDGSGGLRADDTTDGVHLSAAGYERWAAILEDDLDG